MIIYNIDMETEAGYFKYRKLLQPDSWLFQAIEKEFDQWLENSNPASEYKEKYYGDEAIYSKRAAIEQAIENIFDEMQVDGKEFVYLKDIDLAAAFQD